MEDNNPFKKSLQEKSDNGGEIEEEINFGGDVREDPEINNFTSSFIHHLGHFISDARPFGPCYFNTKQLNEANKFLDKLLQVSKNQLLISVLKEIKTQVDQINENSKLDDNLLDELNKSLNKMANIEKY